MLYDCILKLLKQVYKQSWACNYAKRYAAGRDIINQSGRSEDNTSSVCPFLKLALEREGISEPAGADRILSRVSLSPFSFWRILTARQTDTDSGAVVDAASARLFLFWLWSYITNCLKLFIHYKRSIVISSVSTNVSWLVIYWFRFRYLVLTSFFFYLCFWELQDVIDMCKMYYRWLCITFDIAFIIW